MIPCFGFAPGATPDLGQVRRAGSPGVLPHVAVVVITVTVLPVADPLTGGAGVGGAAAACRAGNATIVPALATVAAGNPAYRSAAVILLVASGVVVTASLAPLATPWWAGHFGCNTEDRPDKGPKRPLVHEAA